jgi:DNA-binding response OmpR family regulator
MGKTHKILIIEDEPDVSLYLRTILETDGYKTDVCDTARDGMDRVERFAPDLVSLDIMMPQETGMSFYLKLKKSKKYAHIPVIIISGAVQQKEFHLEDFVPDEAVAPPEAYLEKPIDVDFFLKTVKKLLEKKTAKRH